MGAKESMGCNELVARESVPKVIIESSCVVIESFSPEIDGEMNRTIDIVNSNIKDIW